MLKKVRKYILDQYVSPGILGVFINPFYFSQNDLFIKMKELAPKLSGNLLDIGCGGKPYLNLFNVDSYVGLEFDTPESRLNNISDYYYDGKIFPFSNNSFDSVVCNQVLEHVEDPDYFLSEIYRILKPHGKLILSVPFIWEEHLKPTDYNRYSSFGLLHIFKMNKFHVVNIHKLNQGIDVIFQLICMYLRNLFLTKNIFVNTVICSLIISPFIILGILMSKILPKKSDLFLNLVIFAEKRRG
jgi:SAM-dependent methyltransferase